MLKLLSEREMKSMEWNMEEYIIHYGRFNEQVYSMDYLKNTYDKTRYNDVIKKLKTFKPAVKVEDVIAVALTDYVGKDPVYGIVFTKNKMFIKNQQAYSLYGITNVESKRKTVGTFSKKRITEATITYTDKVVKLTLDGFLAYSAMDFLGHIYSCGSDGKVKDTFKENREAAIEELKMGMDVLFEAYLETYADEDKDACVLLMNYYFDKPDYYAYETYKKIAMEKRAPAAFYHEGYQNLQKGYYKEAYKHYLRSYACGIGTSIYPELLQLRQQLKNIKTVKTPYKYGDLDIDPKMFDCIYPDDYVSSYMQFLRKMNVSSSLINEWDTHNISNYKVKPSREDEKFYRQLKDMMRDLSSFSVRYFSMTDYADKLRESLIPHVRIGDSSIKKLLNGFERLVITDLPDSKYRDARDINEGIGCILDMRTYVGNHQYSSCDNQGAYNYINQLKEYPDFKKKRLNASKKESIAFLENQISGYEEIMRLHKHCMNRFLGLIYMWATPDTDMNILSFDRDEYVEKAKERILLMDEKFLELKNAYLKQLNISESDLFKNKQTSNNKSMQEIKNEGTLLTSIKDAHQEYDFFYPYNNEKDLNYPLKDFMKKVGVKFNKDDILFYQSVSSSGYSDGTVLTKDMLYSTFLVKQIPLKGLIALQHTPYDKLIGLYEDGREVEYGFRHGWDYAATRIINFVNELLIYLW